MNQIKRYIFLDIDGVLNSNQWYKHLDDTYTTGQRNKMTFNQYNIDPRAVGLLNQLTGCEIVISSSWRYCKSTIEGLRDAGLKLPIIGGISHEYFGNDWLTRGNAIARWFKDNLGDIPHDRWFTDGFYHTLKTFSGPINDLKQDPLKPESIALTYVILDDDDDMLLQQAEHFVHVDANLGLSKDDIDHCKEILRLSD